MRLKPLLPSSLLPLLTVEGGALTLLAYWRCCCRRLCGVVMGL
jgi:hypothetical protein